MQRRTIAAFAGIALTALLLRLTSFSQVFTEHGIRFIEPDAYYHIRRIVHSAQDFPHIISFDSYVNYPYGFTIGWPPLFDWAIAFLAFILGFGNPSQHLVETVAAFAPVAIALLTLIPIYYIATFAFGDRMFGVAATGILAILPGHVIQSLVGFTDHHILETFLFSFMILFQILAIRKPDLIVHWSLLQASIFLLAVYSFPGSPIYIGIIGLVLVCQFIIRRIRDLPSRDLLIFGGISLGLSGIVSLIINAILLGSDTFSQNFSIFQPAFLFMLLGVILIAGLLAECLSDKPWHIYVAALIAAGAALSVLVSLAARPLWNAIIGGFGYIAGTEVIMETIIETQSIIFPIGFFTLIPLLDLYGIPLLLALGAICIYIYDRWMGDEFDEADLLLAVTFIFAFTLALYQMRFLNIPALLIPLWAGYGFVQVLRDFGFLREEEVHSVRKKRKNKKVDDPTKGLRKAGILIFFLVLVLPTIYSAANMPDRVVGPPPEDWIDALHFIRDETPVPGDFTDPSETPSYGIMSYWYDGNLILYESERPVVTNNFQVGIEDSTRFFVTRSADEAAAILKKRQIRYIVTGPLGLGTYYNFLRIDGVPVDEITLEYLEERYLESFYHHLYYRDAEGLPAYQLLYSSQRGGETVKVYEFTEQ